MKYGMFRWLPALAAALGIGLAACDKREGTEKTGAGTAGADSAAAEASRKAELFAQLNSEQQFLYLKLQSLESRLEKQGNKTRKRLKPRFGAASTGLEGLASGMRRLDSLQGGAFEREWGDLRTTQDSLARLLGGLEKSLK